MHTKNCLYCIKSFKSKRKNAIYCSRSCQGKDLQKKKIIGVRKLKGFIKTCFFCKKEFYVAPYREKTGNVKYCSRSCLASVHLKNFTQFRFQKTNLPKHKYKTIKIDGKCVREHRHVMEKHLGRKLEKHEHIHHINNDSLDNSIENLKIVTNSEHQKLEYQFKKQLKL